MGEDRIVIESKSSSFWLNLSGLNESIKSNNAKAGIAICGDVDPDKIAAIKMNYPKIRLMTITGLCNLAKLVESKKVPRERVRDILIPMETIVLDNVINLLYSISPPEVKTLEKAEKTAIKPETAKGDLYTKVRHDLEIGKSSTSYCVEKALWIICSKLVDKNNEPLNRNEVVEELVNQGFADTKRKAGRQLAVMSRSLTILIGAGKSKRSRVAGWEQIFQGLKGGVKEVYKIKEEHFETIKKLVLDIKSEPR
jgi:hypothetical protein